MKSNIVILIAIVAISVPALAAPEPDSGKSTVEHIADDHKDVTGKPEVIPEVIPEVERGPEVIVTKFIPVSVKDLQGASTKLKQEIKDETFQAVPDVRTSRMFLMGSKGAIDRATKALKKMEAAQAAPSGGDKPSK